MVSTRLFTAFGIAGLMYLAGAAFGQDHAKEAAKPAEKMAQPAGADDAAKQAEEMKMWAEMAKPVKEHQWMAQFVGYWDSESVTYTPQGAGEPEKGRMEYKLAMGGRFIEMDFEGKFMGQPFHGGGMMGYNKVDQRFESTWADNMGTGMLFMTGQLSDGEKTLTLQGDYTNPMTKQKSIFKEITTISDKDHHKSAFYDVVDGKDVKIMEISYTRATKPAKPAKMMDKGAEHEPMKDHSKDDKKGDK